MHYQLASIRGIADEMRLIADELEPTRYPAAVRDLKAHADELNRLADSIGETCMVREVPA